MDSRKLTLPIFLLISTFQFETVSSHGRLMNPPARNTAWRFGYTYPPNFNDNELFCGGFTTQFITNEGRCGTCGDVYTDIVKPHEWPGKYSILKGITRRYVSGQVILVEFELTSNHRGYIEFGLCSFPYHQHDCFSQESLDRNKVRIVDPKRGTEMDRYVIDSMAKSLYVKLDLLLPEGYNCSYCVLRWKYTAGNNMGICENGTEALGCGPQETFINCAPISITESTKQYMRGTRQHLDPRLTSSSRANPHRKYYRDMTKTGAPMTALAVKFQRCLAISSNNGTKTPGIDEACQSRCMKYPPDCPGNTCKCVKDVSARSSFKAFNDMADQWCLDQCYVYPARDCDETKCDITYAISPT